MSELADLAAEAARVLNEARYITRAADDEAAWSQVGVVAGNYLPRIVELAADPVPAPPVPPRHPSCVSCRPAGPRHSSSPTPRSPSAARTARAPAPWP